MSETASLRNLLLADTALAALVSTRVYSPRLPEGFNAAAKAVLFWREGKTTSDDPFIAAEVSVVCIGDTETNARAVHDALRAALIGDQDATQDAMLRTYGIFAATILDEAEDNYDDEARWPVVTSRWVITTLRGE